MKRIAIVTACDRGMWRLGRGLLLSILEQGGPPAGAELVFLDFWDDGALRAEVAALGVRVRPVEPLRELPADLDPGPRTYAWAMFGRPWLPQLLPGYDGYVWLDADTWVQRPVALADLVAWAGLGDRAVLASPMLDPGCEVYFRDLLQVQGMQARWFAPCYPPELARQFAQRIHFSAGVFALAAASPFWGAYGEELRHCRARVSPEHGVFHLIEQTAFNAAIYKHGWVKRLPSSHNLHANSVTLARDPQSGLVVAPAVFPPPAAGIVHLARSGDFLPRYLQGGLLYRRGEYLAPGERP